MAPKSKKPVAETAKLHVAGPAKGRWRCGWHFGPEATVLEIADLTEDEIGMLMADPELTVVEVAAAPAEPVLQPNT